VQLSLIGTPRSICSLVVPARILFADGLNRYVESVHCHHLWLMCVITLMSLHTIDVTASKPLTIINKEDENDYQ